MSAIFERTIVDGAVIRETYKLPAISPEVLKLKMEVLAKFPDASFEGAFSIGKVLASGFYPEDVVTVYHQADHNHTGLELPRGCGSYAMKFGMLSGKVTIKAICAHDGSVLTPALPEAARGALVGISMPADGKGDLYFGFATEGEYQAYLESIGAPYVAPQDGWPKGLVGLTYDTRTLGVLRVKRYFF